MAPLPHALIPALPLTPTPPSHTLTPTHSRRATATSDAGGTPPAPTPAVAALTGEPAGDDDDSAPPPSSCTTTARHALPSGTAWLAATIRHAGLPGLTRAQPCLHAGRQGVLAALTGAVSNLSDLIDDLAAPPTPPAGGGGVSGGGGGGGDGGDVDWAAWAAEVSGRGRGGGLGAEVLARFLCGRAGWPGSGSGSAPRASSFGGGCGGGSAGSTSTATAPALPRLSSGDGGSSSSISPSTADALAAAAAEVEGAWAFAGVWEGGSGSAASARGLAIAARDASGREGLWWGVVPPGGGGDGRLEGGGGGGGLAFTSDPACPEAAALGAGVAWTELPPGHLLAVRPGCCSAASLRPVRFALSRAEVARREASLAGEGEEEEGGGLPARGPPGRPMSAVVAVPAAKPATRWSLPALVAAAVCGTPPGTPRTRGDGGSGHHRPSKK